jgi:hypothetical protein
LPLTFAIAKEIGWRVMDPQLGDFIEPNQKGRLGGQMNKSLSFARDVLRALTGR